jgi:hypothetical protein
MIASSRLRWSLCSLLALVAACGSHSSGTAGSPPGANPAPPASCNASAAADVEVASDDLNGFPPYAVAGCSLAYVSRAGELVLRDLGTGRETRLAAADERPRRPAVSAEIVAWEADLDGRSVVRVHSLASAAGTPDATVTVTGSFVAAGEPRVSGTSVVFTAWNTAPPLGESDVWLYEARTRDARLALGGAAQQRFADVSIGYIAVTDFSEDPDGRYDGDGSDLADILVLDRASGAITRRPLPGKQAFPMLAENGVLAYLEWNGIHPEPKLTGYVLKSGTVAGNPTADRTIAEVSYVSTDYARPAVIGSTVEWIANPDGQTVLYRAPADGSGSPAAVQGLEALRLFAPAPSLGFTVLATSPVAATELLPRLRAVSR